MASTPEQARTNTPTTYTEPRRNGPGGCDRDAYRDLGDADVPLVLLRHFRGNLDNSERALIDALAADRRVVTFDNVGVGATSGRTPNTVEAMAHGAIALPRRSNFSESICSASRLAVRRTGDRALRPDLLRRVVLASSAPQGAAGKTAGRPKSSARSVRRRRLRREHLRLQFRPPRRAGQSRREVRERRPRRTTR